MAKTVCYVTAHNAPNASLATNYKIIVPHAIGNIILIVPGTLANCATKDAKIALLSKIVQAVRITID